MIPEPTDIDRTGPLSAKEAQQLDRIHAARDNALNARWMRGKALEAAFRRSLFRGEDGTRTRQGYLDDEWDGMSVSAAYLEISEWRLAAEIAERCERPAPDSHVRALVTVSELHGLKVAALSYQALRAHATEHQLRVTAQVVGRLAEFLETGQKPEELGPFFIPHQLPPGTSRNAPNQKKTATTPGSNQTTAPAEPFQNFGMSAEHVARITSWLASTAHELEITPAHAADLLGQLLHDESDSLRGWMLGRVQVPKES
ncbi:hypothetical protein ACFXPM_34160 [Streptomyces sp. NPDC059095]|uniref:hypothetical protein n=1 Tax=unclassified Streptomyces TaxID=2593676 RepID=UPI0035D7CDE4